MRQCLKQISANKGVCCFFLVTEVAFETSEDGNLVDISGLLQTLSKKTYFLRLFLKCVSPERKFLN